MPILNGEVPNAQLAGFRPNYYSMVLGGLAGRFFTQQLVKRAGPPIARPLS